MSSHAERERELTSAERVLAGRHVVALTGAGCSTESGIPDYRGGVPAKSVRQPVQFRDFLASEAARRRYWARSVVGWSRFAAAEPNAAHTALARLERAGKLRGLITQNVDRLHQRAGSRNIVELHGALSEVRCLQCGALEARNALQRRLLAENPDFEAREVRLAPDGDADIADADVDRFRIPACRVCGGMLKPNVVFFGENVAPNTLAEAWRLFDDGEVLLVVGSSLAVFSGFRFAREANRRGMPIVIINIGPTRADEIAALRIGERAGEFLPLLAERLVSQARMQECPE